MKALYFFKILIHLLVFGLLAESTYAQSSVRGKTLIGGIIEGNHTLSITESPFVVNQDIYIRSDATFKIEEGVILGFGPGIKIVVDGTLIIEGTVENPVTFTVFQSSITPEPVLWEGIEISGDYAKVDIKFLDGQLAETLFHINTSSVNSLKISHSFLRENTTAIEFSRLSSNVNIQNNYISDNESGMVFNTPIPSRRIINNQILNNSLFDLVNLSEKFVDMRSNCWSEGVTQKIERDSALNEIIGGYFYLKPVNKNCLPIPEMMFLSGGDITVVIDDDLWTPVDPEKKLDFAIYPNPASDFVKIEYQNLFPSKLLIVNALGQVLEEINDFPIQEITIPVSNLSTGIYHFQLETKYGIFQHRVVVVENW